ncbi:pyrroline-5-carboxylate reductase [Rhizobium laguerreae]|uniref:pyrroline-5-carboxylate reductase n=1 Tax=Rhizobium TaxID=379 RepID=UPI00160C842C|nr:MULTISPECIES: pyrroline-5-carboxylate reductase [Rhizobium]MBB3525816.1 pyrroline-5-carboxylate reductase [Rhizobium sp. BK456]MBY3397164.1 pyrroline-5-carboxylate reductase [Rhizobium laguerreae]MBY3418428.1 pyrroline-5-carboxylate reductase [Rhizobium laguerreae]MBY3425327.1 pyrroline-5-carboxylate reductase [Rhizobium laguerreae]MBY3503505.1 pyrroline-5-carboxylate reductase [Rhizobium laguerreae]
MNRTSIKLDEPLILVGCGNMGYALLRGWIDTSTVDPAAVHVVEPVRVLRERAVALGVNTHETCETLPAKAGIIVFALKPQAVQNELPSYQRFSDGTVFVSIAAGVPAGKLKLLLESPRIVRAMPNTPTSIGKGSTIIFNGSAVEDGELENVLSLFKAGGAVHQVTREDLIDAATAISGSGPAYIFYLIECLGDAARELGLPAEVASKLAKETVHGAAALAFASNDHPAELRRQVTSPNGTTAAAMSVLATESALSALILRATKAAFQRSLELGGAEELGLTSSGQGTK